ncbi:hypothetical protein PAPYR_10532 [Paratrimastix pyriformis]|uniref:adenylate cyclase n=1 Tax=Paratrimastix pyriformis TaxID=342808 RepID=A0ABQ8U8F2_9EUKA|nr:hypothetical protein PAPYR_10532 [Paratrimastix pyriformis]
MYVNDSAEPVTLNRDIQRQAIDQKLPPGDVIHYSPLQFVRDQFSLRIFYRFENRSLEGDYTIFFYHEAFSSDLWKTVISSAIFFLTIAIVIIFGYFTEGTPFSGTNFWGSLHIYVCAGLLFLLFVAYLVNRSLFARWRRQDRPPPTWLIRTFEVSLILVYLVLTSSQLCVDWYYPNGVLDYWAWIFLIQTNILWGRLLPFVLLFPLAEVVSLAYLAIAIVIDQSLYNILISISVYICLTVHLMLVVRLLQLQVRLKFLYARRAAVYSDHCDRIVRFLYPEKVLCGMLDGHSVLLQATPSSHECPGCTVVEVNVAKFSSLITVNPKQALDRLEEFFAALERLCSRRYPHLHPYKVLGSSWVGLVGMSAPTPCHSLVGTLFALDVLNLLHDQSYDEATPQSPGPSSLPSHHHDGPDIHVRIGVASGCLTGGFVGHQWEVWGEALDQARELVAVATKDTVALSRVAFRDVSRFFEHPQPVYSSTKDRLSLLCAYVGAVATEAAVTHAATVHVRMCGVAFSTSPSRPSTPPLSPLSTSFASSFSPIPAYIPTPIGFAVTPGCLLDWSQCVHRELAYLHWREHGMRRASIATFGRGLIATTPEQSGSSQARLRSSHSHMVPSMLDQHRSPQPGGGGACESPGMVGTVTIVAARDDGPEPFTPCSFANETSTFLEESVEVPQIMPGSASTCHTHRSMVATEQPNQVANRSIDSLGASFSTVPPTARTEPTSTETTPDVAECAGAESGTSSEVTRSSLPVVPFPSTLYTPESPSADLAHNVYLTVFAKLQQKGLISSTDRLPAPTNPRTLLTMRGLPEPAILSEDDLPDPRLDTSKLSSSLASPIPDFAASGPGPVPTTTATAVPLRTFRRLPSSNATPVAYPLPLTRSARRLFYRYAQRRAKYPHPPLRHHPMPRSPTESSTVAAPHASLADLPVPPEAILWEQTLTKPDEAGPLPTDTGLAFLQGGPQSLEELAKYTGCRPPTQSPPPTRPHRQASASGHSLTTGLSTRDVMSSLPNPASPPTSPGRSSAQPPLPALPESFLLNMYLDSSLPGVLLLPPIMGLLGACFFCVVFMHPSMSFSISTPPCSHAPHSTRLAAQQPPPNPLALQALPALPLAPPARYPAHQVLQPTPPAPAAPAPGHGSLHAPLPGRFPNLLPAPPARHRARLSLTALIARDGHGKLREYLTHGPKPQPQFSHPGLGTIQPRPVTALHALSHEQFALPTSLDFGCIIRSRRQDVTVIDALDDPAGSTRPIEQPLDADQELLYKALATGTRAKQRLGDAPGPIDQWEPMVDGDRRSHRLALKACRGMDRPQTIERSLRGHFWDAHLCSSRGPLLKLSLLMCLMTAVQGVCDWVVLQEDALTVQLCLRYGLTVACALAATAIVAFSPRLTTSRRLLFSIFMNLVMLGYLIHLYISAYVMARVPGCCTQTLSDGCAGGVSSYMLFMALLLMLVQSTTLWDSSSLVFGLVPIAAFFVVSAAEGVLGTAYPVLLTTLMSSAAVAARKQTYWWQRYSEAACSFLQGIVCQLAPATLANRIRKGEKVQDFVPNATVLFIELHGFDFVGKAPESIGLLSNLFAAFSSPLANAIRARLKFDGSGELTLLFHAHLPTVAALAAQHECARLKFYGTTYVATSGIQNPHLQHAQRCARFALAANRLLAHFAETGKLQVGAVASSGGQEGEGEVQLMPTSRWTVTASMGLASGPLVVGLIGRDSMSLDIWGQPVVLAARLASPDRMYCTESSANLITQATPTAPTPPPSLELSPKSPLAPFGSFSSSTASLANPPAIALRNAGIGVFEGTGPVRVFTLVPPHQQDKLILPPLLLDSDSDRESPRGALAVPPPTPAGDVSTLGPTHKRPFIPRLKLPPRRFERYDGHPNTEALGPQQQHRHHKAARRPAAQQQRPSVYRIVNCFQAGLLLPVLACLPPVPVIYAARSRRRPIWDFQDTRLGTLAHLGLPRHSTGDPGPPQPRARRRRPLWTIG